MPPTPPATEATTAKGTRQTMLVTISATTALILLHKWMHKPPSRDQLLPDFQLRVGHAQAIHPNKLGCCGKQAEPEPPLSSGFGFPGSLVRRRFVRVGMGTLSPGQRSRCFVAPSKQGACAWSARHSCTGNLDADLEVFRVPVSFF